MKRNRGAGLLATSIALCLVAALAALPTTALAASTPSPTATPCGTAAAEVLATTAGSVAERIYAAEVSSSAVLSDKRQIEGDAALRRAMEGGQSAAIKAAVTRLVFSHTHIVRLRVSRGSTLLSDVGGPYILAPVTGMLRSHGRTIGHFVFSVQDDLGYIKLVTRFIGVPLVMRTESGQVPVEGLLSPGPASIPDHGPIAYNHTSYEAYSFKASAYPSGRLRISLLVPASQSLAARTCHQIKAAEMGIVAQRISRRFKLSPTAFADYVKLVHTMTHALVYVRKGSQTLSGSTHTAPSGLPSSGPLRYHGVNYEVSSFSAPTSVGQVRVHVLVGR